MSTQQPLLILAAALIEENAASLRKCNTSEGVWDEGDARGQYEIAMGVARRLREAALQGVTREG